MDLGALIDQQLKPLFPGLMGMSIILAQKDEVRATMEVRPDLCTMGDILHGGAVMAFADTVGAVGAFMNLAEGQHTTTVESKTNFLASAKVGTTVLGISRPVHIGRTLMVWQTEIFDQDDRLVALVTQSQMVLGPPQP